MRTITAVMRAEEKPGRLALAIMAWQRQLADERQRRLADERNESSVSLSAA